MPYRKPLYLYAFDHQENLIHSNQAKSGEIYFCPGCQSRLVLHRGQKYTEHYAHYSETPCGGETYLHNVAKILFLTSYQSALVNNHPFTIKLSQDIHCRNYISVFSTVCESYEMIDFDLTNFFDHAELEVKFGGFIPDILLSSSKHNEVLFIEIAVTHPCEQNKIDSGNRIIEFSIRDEDDLKILKNNVIIPDNLHVKSYNINPSPRNIPKCIANCESEESILGIDAGGIVRKFKGTRKVLADELDSGGIVAHQVLDTNDNLPEVLVYILKQATDKGVSIRNCYLCKYASFNTNFPRVYCLNKTINIPYSEADLCLQYEVAH